MARVDTRPAVGRVLSQHRLRNASVAQRIVAASGLAPPLPVYEFGAGDGVLTAALARVSPRVVAIERDATLWRRLSERFRGCPSVEVVLGDALTHALPRREAFAVVANPPFGLTSPLIRRLADAPNAPVVAALVVQREAALRWSGLAGESLASLLLKVSFEAEVPLALRRRDFDPYPRVDCAVLVLRARVSPVLSAPEEAVFQRLVEAGFRGPHVRVRSNLERCVPYGRFKALARGRGLPLDAQAAALSFEAWVALTRLVGNGQRRREAAKGR